SEFRGDGGGEARPGILAGQFVFEARDQVAVAVQVGERFAAVRILELLAVAEREPVMEAHHTVLANLHVFPPLRLPPRGAQDTLKSPRIASAGWRRPERTA